MSITGEPAGEPTKVGVAVVDVLAGSHLASGVLAALVARGRTGRGQLVEVSLLGSLLAGLVNQVSAQLNADAEPGRMGNAHPSIVPYQTLRTADRPIAVAVGNDRQFARLATAVDLGADPRFATNQSRVRHREALIGRLEERLVTRPAAHWLAVLPATGVPCGPVNTIAEGLALADRLGLAPVVEQDHAGQQVRTVSSPLGLGCRPAGNGCRPAQVSDPPPAQHRGAMLCAVPPIDYYSDQGWGAQALPLRHRQLVAAELLAAALHQRPDGQVSVLDVGCGDGSFLAHVAARVDGRPVRWVGIDYSEDQLAKAAHLPYEYHRCDLDAGIPLPDASMDLVHAAEVIEHLYDPDLLVEECARVLRPGGQLLVTTPNLQSWYNRMLFLAGIQPIFYETSSRSTEVGAGPLRRFKRDTLPVGHLRLFNRTALLDLLRREGFDPVIVRGARFHEIPSAMTWLEALMCRRPSLASILVVLATKR